MSLLEIIGLPLLALLAWYWFTNLKAREAAVIAARAACESEGLLLLDETVLLGKLRPMRDGEGRMRLRRTYEFEYSDTGDNRRRGSVVLLGGEVEFLNIGLRLVPEHRTLH
jgi:hypothetical protein